MVKFVYAGLMQAWTPGEDWWTRHTTHDLVYRVTFRFSSEGLVDEIWAAAASRRRVEDGAILDGGAYLERVGPRDIEAGSGGEDALDSLEFCINDLLFAVTKTIAPKERPRIVREERRVEEDEDAADRRAL